MATALSNGGGAHDSAVMETASDASLCKLSASSLGYYKDPYVQYFVKSPSRRMPIINRGYYARVAAVETLVTKFLAADTPTKKQVVILGAGLDTMFYRLKEAGQLQQCEYFELDFPDVTMQKVMIMKRRKELAALVGLESTEDFIAAVSSGRIVCAFAFHNWQCNGVIMLLNWCAMLAGYAELNAPGYHLLPCDLRDIGKTKEKLEAAGIDKRSGRITVSVSHFCINVCP